MGDLSYQVSPGCARDLRAKTHLFVYPSKYVVQNGLDFLVYGAVVGDIFGRIGYELSMVCSG